MILDYTVNGREQVALGARHLEHAPHGTYQCAARGEDDDDRWIAIACSTDEEWQALAATAKHPEWGAGIPASRRASIGSATRTGWTG